ncbi:hypothetical protein [Desertimonas flava]|uniref:hypothetical protein n=1 Tax=Desertimonas flava TaxID=2064846 RepID=UPI000E34BBE7|nr:hypothetical protein [Desertimonas flava]
MHSRRRRSLLAVAGAAVTLLAGTANVAASTPDEGSGITPEALVAAAEQSATAPSRYEMYLEMSGVAGMPTMGSTSRPLATGSVSGTSSTALMDMSVLMGGLLPLDDDDLTMEMITIEQDLYIRAPFFAALAEMSGRTSGPMSAFVELGDGWAFVDGAALSTDAADIGSLLGANAGNPTAMYAALGTTSKTAPLGTETIHGIPSSGVTATVGFVEMMEAQNLDPSLMPADLSSLADAELPIEVWLGDNGFITRVVFEFDVDTLTAAASIGGLDDSEAELLDEMRGLVTTMIMESFDFNSPDIVIAPPKEYVDMTTEFGELLEMAQ